MPNHANLFVYRQKERAKKLDKERKKKEDFIKKQKKREDAMQLLWARETKKLAADLESRIAAKKEEDAMGEASVDDIGINGLDVGKCKLDANEVRYLIYSTVSA